MQSGILGYNNNVMFNTVGHPLVAVDSQGESPVLVDNFAFLEFFDENAATSASWQNTLATNDPQPVVGDIVQMSGTANGIIYEQYFDLAPKITISQNSDIGQFYKDGNHFPMGMTKNKNTGSTAYYSSTIYTSFASMYEATPKTIDLWAAVFTPSTVGDDWTDTYLPLFTMGYWQIQVIKVSNTTYKFNVGARGSIAPGKLFQSEVFSNNTIHHLALTLDPDTKTAIFYVDGKKADYVHTSEQWKDWMFDFSQSGAYGGSSPHIFSNSGLSRKHALGIGQLAVRNRIVWKDEFTPPTKTYIHRDI